MLIFITSIVFLLPKRILRFIVFGKIKNFNILEILLITPLMLALILESIKSNSHELLFLLFLLFGYLMLYILISRKIVNKLKYNLKLYNLQEFENIKVKRSKIFYFSKIIIIFLLVYYTLFENIIEVGLFSVLIFAAIIIYLLMAKKQQIILQKEYNTQVIDILNNYNPSFVFYFTAPNSKFLNHITMWLPYLKKCNLNFYIMVREDRYLAKLLKVVDDIPIVVVKNLSSIEEFLPQSTKLAFYANNGTKNTHLIRFNDITHVLLLHGESEKPPSYNPMAKIYDKLFVSGQRAIDRYYENNVNINKDNFITVGRPQVSQINIVQKNKTKDKFNILIAPTWQGLHTDAQFSSLLKIYDLTSLLLNRKEDIRIIIRLHPLTNTNDIIVKELLQKVSDKLNNSTIEHICFSTRDIADDFNESDCIITDISSVPIDYIYSHKPIIHVDVNNLSDALENDIKYKEYAKAIYLIDDKLNNLDDVFDKVFHNDILFDSRIKVKEYYHGKLNQPSEDVFCQEIHKLISNSK